MAHVIGSVRSPESEQRRKRYALLPLESGYVR